MPETNSSSDLVVANKVVSVGLGNLDEFQIFMEEFKKSMHRMEIKIDRIDHRIDTMEQRIDQRMDTMELNMFEGFKSLRQEINDGRCRCAENPKKV